MSLYHPRDPFSLFEQWNSQEFSEAPTPRAYSMGPSPLPSSIEFIPGLTRAFDEEYEGCELVRSDVGLRAEIGSLAPE
jgi:hypothetical protein